MSLSLRTAPLLMLLSLTFSQPLWALGAFLPASGTKTVSQPESSEPVVTPEPKITQPAPTPVPTPAPTPEPELNDPEEELSANRNLDAVADISSIAASSSCAKYSWKDRGKAPAAYIKGMALVFAKSLCRLRAGEDAAEVMAQKNRNNSTYDALTWYESLFDAKKLEIDRSGVDTLRSVYTLGIGLGMRESSGKYCEGYDVAVSAQSSTSAEAGLFQTSYNSMGANAQLKVLYNQYKSGSKSCHLSTFSANVTCKARSIVGSGSGADFQRLAKSCPAFAVEYAMVTLRTLRKHYGPIVRKEAELNSSCNQMLSQVQDYVEAKSAQVCPKL